MVFVAVLLPPLLLCMMLALGRYEEWMLRPPRSSGPSRTLRSFLPSRTARHARRVRDGARHLHLIRGGAARSGTPSSPPPVDADDTERPADAA